MEEIEGGGGIEAPYTSSCILSWNVNQYIFIYVKMQKIGHQVTWEIIIVKGNEIYPEVNGTTRSVIFFECGWSEWFMQYKPIFMIMSFNFINWVS